MQTDAGEHPAKELALLGVSMFRAMRIIGDKGRDIFSITARTWRHSHFMLVKPQSKQCSTRIIFMILFSIGHATKRAVTGSQAACERSFGSQALPNAPPISPITRHRRRECRLLRSQISGCERHLMLSGKVRFYDHEKRFGSIASDACTHDVFVHATALERAGVFDWPKGSKLGTRRLAMP